MTDRVDVPDLGKKIELLLRSDKKSIRSADELMRKLEFGKDYWSRIRNGTRVMPEETFLKLCDLFSLEQREWFHPLLEFGKKLGYTRREISVITNTPLPGIDFSSRIRDSDMVTDLFAVLEGYWESFYFSVSRVNRRLVSKDLFIVRRMNEDNYIECEVNDSLFIYKGWCFPIKNHLYLVLEKDHLFNEIIVYATNLPDRQPPRLFGIILCLSGGVDEMHSFPCAAKVAFRYLGKLADVQKRFNLDPGHDPDEQLAKIIPAYVDPADPTLDADTAAIIHDISNVLPESAIPSALRMVK